MQSIFDHLPEAVLCCKGASVNKRCRECAFALINKMALLAIKTENNLDNFLNALSAGLAGSIPMMSCTILALASVLHNCKSMSVLNLFKPKNFCLTFKLNVLDEVSSEQFEMIVNNICLLLTTGTREVVNAGLSFIKVIIASFSNDLMPQLPNIVCIIIIE